MIMCNDIYSNPKKDSRGKYGENIWKHHLYTCYTSISWKHISPFSCGLHEVAWGCMRLHEVKILHIEIATITTLPSVRTPSANGTSTALWVPDASSIFFSPVLDVKTWNARPVRPQILEANTCEHSGNADVTFTKRLQSWSALRLLELGSWVTLR